jgi:hypothetical protein
MPSGTATVIDTLARYSLLKREPPEGPVTAYSMHRVLQPVVRERLVAASSAAEPSNTQWLAAASAVVNAAFPFDSDEPPFCAASDALLPHARAIREHLADLRDADPPASLGRLLSQASLYLRVRGLYAEARDFRELALESDLAVRAGPIRQWPLPAGTWPLFFTA